ncbi:MAG TPA: protein kinase, partial [Gemmatimonadales bacterium]|nr:protein kinase [Gemmatimonadales bacterium]
MTEVPSRLREAIADRYALERELGSGGMATVYLALDLRHDRKVAVKVLRPELAATLGPDRFLREIRIAAQLQHPHILPLLDSGEADGFLYYVMPYIEGESLRDRVAEKGELPIAETTRLLRDVVDALSYAHGRGVVHRDIKPDNIMLSGRHALVMDFGVAKAVSEATGRQTLTTVGVALGTPAYMAPEQAAADPHVDHRADLYAVGVMGYELLTGRPPFTGVTPQQVLAAHVTEMPRPVTELRSACPPALAEVIMRCLAKRPADRWQSAEEVLDRLESLGTTSGGTTPSQTIPTAAVLPGSRYGSPIRVAALFLLVSVAVLGAVYFLTIQLGLPDWVPWVALGLLAVGLPIMVITGLIERRRAVARATGVWSPSGETGVQRYITWKKATRGGYLAFGALGVAAAGYTAMRVLGIGPVGTLLASGNFKASDKVIVADFVTRTSDSTLGPSISEAFRIDLAQSPVVTLISTAQVGDALDRMQHPRTAFLTVDLAREVAQREGAKAVVVGEIGQVGKSYALAARLLAAKDGAELVALRETADNDGEILKAVDRLSKRMRERIGESLRTIRTTDPLEQVTTSSLEALRLYTDGVRAASIADNARAISLLRQAVSIDTGFAMAWRKLAVALNNSGGSTASAIDATTRAYAHRDRLPERERYQTTAFYFWKVENDRDKAIAAYRAVLAIDPEDLTALLNLAAILGETRQWASAESLAVRGVRVDPHTVAGYDILLNAQLGQGKTADARATLDRFAKAMPGNPALGYYRMGFYVATGAADSALAIVRAGQGAIHDLSMQAGLAFARSGLDRWRGRLAAAEQDLHEAAALSEQRDLPGQALMAAAAISGDQAIFLRAPALASATLDSAL